MSHCRDLTTVLTASCAAASCITSAIIQLVGTVLDGRPHDDRETNRRFSRRNRHDEEDRNLTFKGGRCRANATKTRLTAFNITRST
jgi:hypothetical protein